MFGFSLTKLLVLVVVIVVVWQAFKRFGPVKARRKATPNPTAGIDTVQCAVCGVYVAAREGGCERKDCPNG